MNGKVRVNYFIYFNLNFINMLNYNMLFFNPHGFDNESYSQF